MVKVFCDRCGNESGVGHREVKTTLVTRADEPVSVRSDLCGFCFEAIREVLKPPARQG